MSLPYDGAACRDAGASTPHSVTVVHWRVLHAYPQPGGPSIFDASHFIQSRLESRTNGTDLVMQELDSSSTCLKRVTVSMPVDAKDLAGVLPFEDIRSYFAGNVAREEFRTSELAEIAKHCRPDLFSLAINCGIRAKRIYKPELDMASLVPDIQAHNPLLVDTLTLLLGEDSLDDIYCCRCTFQDKTVASLLIAQVWPRDLYIGMVMFADPSKPIPVPERKSVLQKFRGLGLLSTFLDRVESCARARGCQNITLVANETSQMTLFAKYGFVVDDYPMAANQLAEGKAIPMHKALA